MKNYKHKKTGDVATLVSECGYKLNQSTIGLIPKEYIENSSDWIPIEEKTWQIVAISTGTFSGITTSPIDINAFEEGYEANNWKIQSIKRASDGEVFKVGETVSFGNIAKGKILLIEISDAESDKGKNVLKIHNDNPNFGPWWEIGEIGKLKSFLSEDEVRIFDFDQYFSLHKCKFNIERHIRTCSSEDPEFLYFSTREAAEKYAIMNKPCLSIRDVQSIYTSANEGYRKNGNGPCYFNELEKIVKSRI